jgi:hypothetical protein
MMARSVGESVRVSELVIRFRGAVKVVSEAVRVGEFFVTRGIPFAKTYIKRLASALRGMARGSLKGSTRGGKF